MPNEFWPDDPAGYIFLARAFEHLGKHRFGVKWTGSERRTTATHIRSDNEEYGGRVDVVKMCAWLNDDSPGPFGACPFGEELKRKFAIRDEISGACRSGALASAARAPTGGPMHPLPATAWMDSEATFRFDSLKVLLPRAGVVAEKQFGWIFLENSTFEMLIGRTDVQTIQTVHLSVYVRTMLEVIRELGIAPAVQPKKEALKAIFLEKLEGLSPRLPRYLAEAMAALVRQPDSREKRGRPPKGAAKRM